MFNYIRTTMEILSNLKKRFKSVESDSKEFSAKLPEPFFISNPNINLFICWNDSPKYGIDIDGVIIGLPNDNLNDAKDDIIFYNNTKSQDGSILLYEGDGEMYDIECIDCCFDCFIIDLNKVSLDTNKILIFATIYDENFDFSKVVDLYLKIYERNTRNVLFEYRIDKTKLKGRAIELGALYRDVDNKWFFKPLLSSFKDGLKGVVEKYIN